MRFFSRIFRIEKAPFNRIKVFVFGVKIFSCRRKNLRITQAERNKLDEIRKDFPEVLSFREMLRRLQSGASLCRFGDAEFDIALAMNEYDAYQKPSSDLTRRLLDILNSGVTDKLIVSIPPFTSEHNNPAGFYKDLSFWEWYWLMRYDALRRFFAKTAYGNSFFSRDAVFYELPLEELISLWSGRRVAFVIPENGRFRYDARLFGSIREKIQIFVPPVSAFSEYDRILSECVRLDRDVLFFICAGPTAAVLAADLAARGYQALDMGHFSNCYLEYLGEADKPENYPMISGLDRESGRIN